MILKPKGSNDAFKALGMVGSFGFMMGGSVCGGYLIGSLLDNWLNTSPWLMITFIIMGLTAGFIEFFKIVKRITKEK